MRKIAESLLTRFYGNAYLLLVLTMLFWGGNTVAGRLAVGEISPVSLTSFRWILAGVIMCLVSRTALQRAWPAFKQRPVYMIAMATFGFTVYNALFYWSAHMTTAVNIAIISGSMPAFILLGSSAVFHERIGGRQASGMLLGIAGVVLVAIQGDIDHCSA